MKIDPDSECPCGCSKKIKNSRVNNFSAEPAKKYVNDAHEWMDVNITLRAVISSVPYLQSTKIQLVK